MNHPAISLEVKAGFLTALHGGTVATCRRHHGGVCPTNHREEFTVKVLDILIALALAGALSSAAAQYPAKPVRVILPFALGGTADIVARVVTQKITANTGKAFVIEVRTGAGGRIGYEAAAKSPGDGYTLVATDLGYTMLPALYGSLPWDHANDLIPVTISAYTPFLIVANPNRKAASLSELIAQAKASPGAINFGSAGNGTVNHIYGELFKREAHVELTHVPYKGMSDAVLGMLSGSIDLLFIGIPVSLPHLTSGKAIALAIAATRRSPTLPNVPTVVEAGLPGFLIGNWFGLTAPKGTPKEAIDWLHREIVKALAATDVRERLAGQGAETSGIAPEELGKMMREDTRRWTELIRSAGIRGE